MQYHRLLPAIFILFMGHFAHATEALRIGVLYWSMNIPGQVAMRQGLEAEAERLNAQRPDSLAPLNVCIQVNISGESQKAGTTEAEVLTLATQIRSFPRLTLRGLMAIAENTEDEAVLRESFGRLHTLFRQLQPQFPGLDTLSIGMTQDMEVAIASGSTQVRVGTAIFGERDYPAAKG